MSIEPFIRKIANFVPLSDEDRALLGKCIDHVVEFGARDDIIRRGEKPEYVHLLLDGWAGRYKDLADGSRQIMAFLIPGDICDLHVALLKQMDHSIGALSPCSVGFIEQTVLNEITDNHKNLAKAFWLTTLIDEAVSREWLVSIGRRSAEERLAHFLCEIFFRSKAVGLEQGDSFGLPLIQEHLADAMGMSLVHMNRSIQKLRATGLVIFSGRQVEIKDLTALMRLAEFDRLYLHQMNREAGSDDARSWQTEK